MKTLELKAWSGIEGNLPSWPGASHCYKRAYRMLENMALHGHVRYRTPSSEMDDLIEALDRGDEEKIKGLLMLYSDRGYETTETISERVRRQTKELF